MNSNRIVDEYLYVYKAFKPQQWFTRHYSIDGDKDVYEFGSGLKGPKSTWEAATRPNSLFLSMAVQLNSEQLKPVFEWFAKRLVVFNEVSRLTPQFTTNQLQQAEKRREICNFLNSADISIADVDVVTRKVPGQTVQFDIATGKTQVRTEEIEQSQVRFHHATEKGKAEFSLDDESSGTRQFFSFAGPILDILEKGLVLVIDELDTSLHTLIARELIRLFHRSDFNKAGAQLIFTTHDTSLLDAPFLFRRDQIWLVDKDAEQSSRLTSLSDFSPRKKEALERGYLLGRYGGVPFLSDMFEVNK